MKKIVFLLFLTNLIQSGCDTGYTAGKIREYEEPEPPPREWTMIVYMAADNDLDGAALEDFNELEAVDYEGKPVTVLALIDRKNTSSGNWSDTRLYEIKSDPGGKNTVIISKRLDGMPELNISSNSESEIDTGNQTTLSGAINCAKRLYPADNYGLIVWGYGLGWKGCLIDDTSNSSMTLSAFNSAIADKGLSVAAFDTDFGVTLESAYEIRGGAAYMVGTPNVTPDAEKGWDYQKLFTGFLGNQFLSAEAFCKSVVEQFQQQYGETGGACISVIDMSKVDALFAEFENFSTALADKIGSETESDEMYDKLINGTIETYYDKAGYPADVYADIYSLSLQGNGKDLQIALSAAVTSWSREYGTTRGLLGVFVNALSSGGVFSSSHLSGYKKGSGTIKFIQASNNWVPSGGTKGESLLDKIFYYGY
jgi:hypothetical protein